MKRYVCVYIYIYIYTHVNHNLERSIKMEKLEKLSLFLCNSGLCLCPELRRDVGVDGVLSRAVSIGKLKLSCDVIVVSHFSHQVIVFE